MHLHGGGYMFINPRYLNKLTNRDVQTMFTDRGSFLMIVRKPGNKRLYGALSQLKKYRYVCKNMVFSKHFAHR